MLAPVHNGLAYPLCLARELDPLIWSRTGLPIRIGHSRIARQTCRGWAMEMVLLAKVSKQLARMGEDLWDIERRLRQRGHSGASKLVLWMYDDDRRKLPWHAQLLSVRCSIEQCYTPFFASSRQQCKRSSRRPMVIGNVEWLSLDEGGTALRSSLRVPPVSN